MPLHLKPVALVINGLDHLVFLRSRLNKCCACKAKGDALTEAEKLKRDIDTLRESIRLDWAELDQLPMSADERAGIREHIKTCVKDLTDLLARLDGLNAERP